ncbi:type II CAAX prenyl endopeptidase Rce1 family protein [Saccharothrix sp.]|uniref:CPBP family glutamic-type intramembrane protease n=1 Tax=Saccharothrix sp. TaxID=1873460 RepID=UPI0028127DA8|nr:CPBP family glutamic-type intramembrane protease [Saccharothrix sp.]
MAAAASGTGALSRALLPATNDGWLDRHLPLAVQGLCWAALVVLAVRPADRRSWSDLALASPHRGWRPAAAGILAWLLPVVAGLGIVLGTGALDIAPAADPPAVGRLALLLPLTIVVTFVVYSLPAESLFRGYVYTNLAERMRGWPLLTATTTLQTLVLLAITPTAGLPAVATAFGTGIGLTYLRAVSGTVWFCAAVHATSTSFGYLLNNDTLHMTDETQVRILLGILPLAVAIVMVARLARRSPRCSAGNRPDPALCAARKVIVAGRAVLPPLELAV